MTYDLKASQKGISWVLLGIDPNCNGLKLCVGYVDRDVQRLPTVTRSSCRRTRSCRKRGTLGHTGRLSVKNFSMKFLSIHSLVRKKIKTNRIVFRSVKK